MSGRAAATDPLHAFRFHAKMIAGEPVNGIPGANPNDVLQPSSAGEGFIAGQGAEAGFQSITSPELTQEPAEYREGIRTYTQKFPGVPSVNDITMIRGCARFDTSFISWILAAAEGDEYRGDLTIYHIQRPKRELAIGNQGANMAATEIEVTDKDTKRYILRDAFPTRVKIAGDLDSSTSDVSLSEIDVAYERFDIELPKTAAA
ncbi:MAG: phage tail protein [Deltaproteobacteria bacterium]|nr:phage tail protein [Deltaproteobacteria bacterium]